GRATDQAATVVADAEDGRSVFQVTALDLGLAVAVTQLGAVEVLAQDDVDHTADGVGTVHRGGTVGEDLDALHGGQRNGVHVGAVRGRHRVGRCTTAVDQQQAAARTQAVEVVPQDEVVDTAVGVGTVHRGGTVGAELDALHGGQRNGVHVGAVRGRHRVGGCTTAVDQHQGAARTQAAQVDRRQRLGGAAR